MSKLRITTTVAIIITLSFSLVSSQAPSPGPSVALSPTSGPSGAPGPAVDPCMAPLLNLSDCLSFVINGSTETKPDKNCCPELAGLVESNPVCLCELLSQGAGSYGISIDVAKALNLPSLCHVRTPSVSLCSAFGYPVSAPTSSIATSPPMGFPAAAPSSSVNPSGVAASPNKGKDSGGSSVEKPPEAFSIVLALAFVFTFLI